jgi:hypothetical protein
MYQAITVYGVAFQPLPLALEIFYLMQADGSTCTQYGNLEIQSSALVVYMSQPPNNIRLPTYSPTNWQAKVIKVWAIPRSLATTNRIIGYFLFLWVLRCFSSPAYRYPILYIQTGATRHNSSEVSPFGHLRIKIYWAIPRSFSQLITSFIGILRQGIRCARLSNFLRLFCKYFGEDIFTD